MYLILTQNSEVYAQTISQLIWAVSRPASARSAGDVSNQYCGWIVHSDGRVALQIPDSDTVYVHPDGDAKALVDSVRAVLPSAEADALEATINTAKGGRVTPINLIPASLAGNERTRVQMDADGWFPEI